MAETIQAGVLWSRRVPAAVGPDAVSAAARLAAERLSCPIEVETLIAEELIAPPAKQLLVHALGSHVSDCAWGFLLDAFRCGAHLLSVGCFPFTRLYRVVDGEVVVRGPVDDALHAIGLVDTCVSTGAFPAPEPRDVAPRFEFLNETGLPPLAETCSMDVRLATQPQAGGNLYASHGEQEADFEVACRLFDDGGRAAAAPIVRFDHYRGGRLTFLNFDPADPGYYDTPDGQAFLSRVIASALSESWYLNVEPRYSRYFPGETVDVFVEARPLAPPARETGRRVRLELVLHEAAPDRVLSAHEISLRGGPCQSHWELGGLPEGRYTVRAVLEAAGEALLERVTGFYLLGDARARGIACSAPRLATDAAVAPDYCVVEGRPYPMTGTTYMVRGAYRDCFGKVNVAVAFEDMRRLSAAGINILRTGVWTTYELVYLPEGGFREEALRSLDAFFLAAAEHGLPVQFAPAAFVMNHWDRAASMFHDPYVRAKVMRCVSQFARRFAGWPGVQLDLINEPSYAPFLDGFLWQLARPTGDPGELPAWHEWLRTRYRGDLAMLRDAWGLTSDALRTFEDVPLPAGSDFETNYDGPPHYDLRAMLADFYAFADDTFANWTAECARLVRQEDPYMPVMVGRDETLRVPSQQRDAFEGNIDLINWHQWHREGTMFSEYVLNRVRGLPCCGQEMGVLSYKDQRNSERLSERDVAHQLERKLVYCLGNWIQWQSFCDPTMHEYKETKLGMIRVDGTERSLSVPVRLLAWLERAMAHRLVRRREDNERLALVVPTSLWFSSDGHLGYRAAMQAILALHVHLKRPAYAILESLLRDDNRAQYGNPSVVILPSATVLSEAAWRFLLRRVAEDGILLLVTGSVDQDSYWRRQPRLRETGLPVVASNLATVERLSLDGRTIDLTFREAARLGLPGKALLRGALDDQPLPGCADLAIGRGRLVYCPLPVELADGIEATVALYRQVLAQADLPEPLVTPEAASETAAHFIYPIAYRDVVAISLVNEGTEATFAFRVAPGGTRVEAHLAKGRAAKVYLGRDGQLRGGLIHGRLRVGEEEYEPGGDLAFFRDVDGWRLLAGQPREGRCIWAGRECRLPAWREQWIPVS